MDIGAAEDRRGSAGWPFDLSPVVLAREPTFSIGRVEIRPATREIVRDGQAYIIEPRVMQLLVALRRANGGVVSKNDLAQLVWEGRIVGDDAINRVVSRLRGVADNQAGGAFSIETITKVGYRMATASSTEITSVEAQSAQGRTPSEQATIGLPKARRILGNPLRWPLTIAGLLTLILALAIGFRLSRPAPPDLHSMTVRLAGFQALSPGLPRAIGRSVDGELAAAFNADGVVGVSNAAQPPPGKLPSYSLGGSIERKGQSLRVIATLANERSGTALWSGTFDFEEQDIGRVPRRIAVAAGNVVRCGLFGASTYHRPLPDDVMRNYLQFCDGFWDPNVGEGRRALLPAQRVVGAAPDFSWGWAALAGAYWKVAGSAESGAVADNARRSGHVAADRAVAIDSRNSEALYIKAMLADRHDWSGRAALLERAVSARRLDCGCEHHQYGALLADVGRVAEALEQLHQANDMLALYVYTPLSLANVLVAAGKPIEARHYFDAAIDLAPDQAWAERLAKYKAIDTFDIAVLENPRLPLRDNYRAAVLQAAKAAAASDPAARTASVRRLLDLRASEQDAAVALLLGKLGADHQAFLLASTLADKPYPGPMLFWHPWLRGALRDPGFPSVAARLGLLDYWRHAHVTPDVCNEHAPPPFCAMI